jgi:hypothetical protein
MPKEIMQMAIDRAGNEAWGFIIIGGKDQSLTVKVSGSALRQNVDRLNVDFQIVNFQFVIFQIVDF